MLSYVRVWHAGAIVSSIVASRQYTGITMAGVGSGTIVDHCEVGYSLDDGLQLLGGTVAVRRLSVLFAGDDAYYLAEGYQGRGQYLFAGKRMMAAQRCAHTPSACPAPSIRSTQCTRLSMSVPVAHTLTLYSILQA